MNDNDLQQSLRGIPSLRGLFVTAMPDCLLFHSWMRREEEWAGEEVAAYFGDLIRANSQGLRALQAWSSEMQVTIEASDVLLVLRELPSDFVVGFVFEKSAPLGVVRVHVKQVLALLDAMLPKIQPEQRARGVRIAEFLVRYAPDAHTAMQRAALKSGISLALLNDPQQLTPDQTRLFENSVCDILGLDALSL